MGISKGIKHLLNFFNKCCNCKNNFIKFVLNNALHIKKRTLHQPYVGKGNYS